MKRLLSVMMAITFFEICNAQTVNNQSGILSAQEAKYVLEVFCQNFYSSCFEGKKYIPGTLIVKSVGVDQNTGGTYVSGIHSYQGQYVPFKGRKSHNDVQFNATIVRQRNGDYVIFNKWYEPDLMNRKGGWETGQKLIQYNRQ